MWGRRRQIPELRARNWQVRTLGERLAVNSVIQGTAADIMKLGCIRVDSGLHDSPVKLTVHDELLFEGPADALEDAREAIVEGMIGMWEHKPPLAIDIRAGPTWMEAK